MCAMGARVDAQGGVNGRVEVGDRHRAVHNHLAQLIGDANRPAGAQAAAGQNPAERLGVVPAAALGKRPQSLSPARDALLKKGLIYSGERGRIAFTVPHFGRYLLQQA